MHPLKGMPIKFQLIFLALAISIITFCMYIITYSQVSYVITQNNDEYVNNIVTQMKQTISQNSSLMGRIMTNIAYNEIIQRYIIGKDTYKRYEDKITIDNFLYNIQEVQEGIIDIVILGDSGASYSLKGMNNGTNSIIKKMPPHANNYFSGMEEVTYQDQRKKCIVLTTTINSIISNYNQGKKIGTAAIVLDTKVLGLNADKKFDSSFTKFYLADRNGIIYSSNDQTLLGEKINIIIGANHDKAGASEGNITNRMVTIDGKKWIVNTDSIPEIGGSIVSAVPEDKLFDNVLWMRKLTIFVFIVALTAISIPFLIIANNIVNPLKRMMEFMSTVKKDDFNSLKQRIRLKGYLEIETMACEFNKLLDKVTELTDGLVDANTNLYETKLAKKRSELAYLKSQINPHFLYNTLETMKGSAIEENAPNTLEMTKALGQIFRYSIKGDDLVRLSDEFEIIKSYVKIQQIRFNDRIKVRYEFTDDVLSYIIPKMIIQPLVENAVFHGLEAKLGSGNLLIGGKIVDEDIMSIWIKDDGVGIDSQKLDDINRSLTDTQGKQEIQSGGHHMGLFNVNNRIRLAFGEQYGLRLISSMGAGTEVIMKIPAIGGDSNV